MKSLEDLLKPKVSEGPSRFSCRIDGQPKTGKTALALTASAQCPHPSKWDPKNPVDISDILWLQFEENCLMYPQQKGINVTNVFDWSDPNLTWKEIGAAIKALPGLTPQMKEKGIKTIVVDTLSALDSLLIRDLVDGPEYAKDSDRIKAYGLVNSAHDFLFDKLRATGLNFIGLVHLDAFQPWGEDGTNEKFAKAAENQVHKVEAMNIGGIRADFTAAIRKKAAARWARLTDATLVTFAEEKAVRAGVKQVVYRFTQSPSAEFNAGGRWNLGTGDLEPYLYPHLKNMYGI